MKVLVTGATGLLGNNVVRILRSRGVETRILTRNGSAPECLEGIETEIYTGDITDPDSLVRASHGCDAIVHAAANTSQWPTGYRYYHEINVKGTENIVNATRVNRIDKLIYVSSVNAFGSGTHDEPGTELSEFSMFRCNSGYVTSKYIAQQFILSEAERHGLPAVVVNPSIMIGPNDPKPSSGKMILMCLNKPVWFCPSAVKNFIDVRDAAMAIFNALFRGVNGECYILANENLSFYDFYKKVIRIDGNRRFLVRVPKGVTSLSGIFGSLYSGITHRPVALNRANSRLLSLNSCYSGKKAVEELGMPQTPVDSSIADALDWFYRNGYVEQGIRNYESGIMNYEFFQASHCTIRT